MALTSSPLSARARSVAAQLATMKRSGASYLPLSSGDVAQWEVEAKAAFLRRVLGSVSLQAAAACAFATAPLLSPAVRTFVLSHPGVAYAAMLLPLLLLL